MYIITHRFIVIDVPSREETEEDYPFLCVRSLLNTSMSSFNNSTIEVCLLEQTEPSFKSKIRLSEEMSLYQNYVIYCQPQGVNPVELRALSKAVEFLLEKHFLISSPKTRDQQGILYKGIKLRSPKTLCVIQSL